MNKKVCFNYLNENWNNILLIFRLDIDIKNRKGDTIIIPSITSARTFGNNFFWLYNKI